MGRKREGSKLWRSSTRMVAKAEKIGGANLLGEDRS